jgi:nicotinate-nucleotide--dimethylbenzimidazole phosphoribosyltransferase
VTAHGVSAYRTEVTRHVAEAALSGTSVGAVAAGAAGLDLVIVDAGVAGPPLAGARMARPVDARGDLVHSDGLTAADTERLVAAGAALPLGAGLVAVGEVGVGNTTVAAALAAGLLGRQPGSLIGLGAGSDSAMVEAKRRVVSAALARLDARGAGADPLAKLAALGGGELAVLAGAVLGITGRGGVVVLDGLATSVAALVAVELEPAVAAHLIAGQRSREVGHQVVLAALGLEPVLDLRLRAGEGAGAAMAVTVLRSGVRIRTEAAQVR